MASKLEYGEGSIFQKHVKGCDKATNRMGESVCGCRWAGTLEAGWTENNKRRRITVTAKTEAAVRRRLRDRRADLNNAKESASASDVQRKTIRGWADEWMEIRQREVRPNTWTSDRAAIYQYVVPIIGTRRLLETGPRELLRVDAKVRAAGHGSSTVLRVRRTLIKLLRDAVTYGYAVPDGVFQVKSDKRKGRVKPKRAALEVPQAVAVLAHASDLPHGTRYLTALYQGVRQGEALGLTWDCVDFDAGVIHLRHQLQAVPYADKHDRSKGFRLPDDYEAAHLVGRFHLVPIKTEAGERIIPMVPTISEALRTWREQWPTNPHNLVWARADGWPIAKASDTAEFHQLQNAAGVKHPSGRPFTTHEMRNTTASLLREIGADELTITAIMGHSSYATSQGYMTVRSPQLLASLKAVEAAFKAPSPEIG